MTIVMSVLERKQQHWRKKEDHISGQGVKVSQRGSEAIIRVC